MIKIAKFVGGWIAGFAAYKFIIFDLIRTMTNNQDLILGAILFPTIVWTIAYSVVAFNLLIPNRNRHDD